MIVEYESDAYGFVQEKRAMRQFGVVGMMNVFDFLWAKDQSTWNQPGTSFTDVNNQFVSGLDIPSLISQEVSRGATPTQAAAIAASVFSGINPYCVKYGSFKSGMIPNNVLIFKLDESINSNLMTYNSANELVKRKYFLNPVNNRFINELYLKLKVEVKEGIYEYVPCILPISKDENFIFANLTSYSDSYKSFGLMPKSSNSQNYEYGMSY